MMYVTLLLLSCAQEPYPEYWDANAGPSVASVSPDSVDSLAGGDTVRIQGSGLSGTRTVVVGTRNASIVEATDGYVDVLLPAGAPGGGAVDVAVVTDAGVGQLEGGFTYAIRGQEFWTDEVASATLYKVDCPVEVWSQASPQAEWEYSYWCGVEFGYAGAYAFDGSGPQPGFSGDQADFVELSTLPAVGEVEVWEPGARRPPAVPYLYGVHADGEYISITTPRDFGRDLDIIAEREEMLRSYYYWYQEYPEAFTWNGPVVGVYGPDGCYEQDLYVTDGYDEVLEVDGAPGQASGVILGYHVTEDYGHGPDHVWESIGYTGTATASVEGGDIIGDATGVELVYDGYSGWYFSEGVAWAMGPSDLPAGAAWDVAWTRPSLDDHFELGRVVALEDLAGVRLREDGAGVGSTTDLLAGDVAIMRGSDLIVSWEPGADVSDDAMNFVMIEIRVYDADLDDPYWMTEVARLVAQGSDESGSITISSDELQKLPEAVNDVLPSWNLAGYWAEMSVARHQLRKVSLEESELGDGDLVIDFIHVVNSPVMLRDR